MQFQKYILNFFYFDLVETQRKSFLTFLKEGIIREISKRNPITDSIQGLELVFFPKNYKLTKPKITPKQALLSSKTYDSQLYVPVAFIDQQNKVTNLQWILLGNLPLMTKRGHFIINGSPRVIVHQMGRSPGIYFQEKKNIIYYADLIPFRGSWIRLEIDKKGQFWVRRKKTPKIPLVIFLQALGLNISQILNSLEYPEKLEIYLQGDYQENGQSFFDGVPIRAKNVTQALDIISSLIYSKKLVSSLTPEIGHKFLFRKFMDSRTYDLGKVGRMRLNQKLGSTITLSHHTLTSQDFLGITNLLIKFGLGLIPQDDIDDLKNRRVRTSGELLQNQLGTGLVRLEKVIRERMKKSKNSFTLRGLITTKAINGAFREFFGSSPLSQYMDQTNPLSEITHKRRLSSLGPGGITRETAGMAVRGIHPSHYGRICPIETPEGQNAGLVNSITTYSRINNNGFLETPFFSVFQGQLQNTKGLTFFSAEHEKKFKVATGDIKLLSSKFLPKNFIPSRYDQEIHRFKKKHIEFMAISSLQMISVATSLIPFLEHDDANRALMGSNMQRQAVSLMVPERPLVLTGLEARVIANSGQIIQARKNGLISYISGNTIFLTLPVSFSKVNKKVLAKQKNVSFFFAKKNQLQKNIIFLNITDDLFYFKLIRNKKFHLSQSFLFTFYGRLRSQSLDKNFQKKCFTLNKNFYEFSQREFLYRFFSQLVLRRKKFLTLKYFFKTTSQKLHILKPEGKLLNKYKKYFKKQSHFIKLFNEKKTFRKEFFVEKVNTFFTKNLVPCRSFDFIPTENTSFHLKKKTDIPLFYLPFLKKKDVYSSTFATSSKQKLNQNKTFFETLKYSLQGYTRSNQDTCLKQRPSICEGEWVQKGDILADCFSSIGGELALGKNILVAYMPWEGYNFEDAILINQRLVTDDIYTSIHINRYETEVRETKFGVEKITSQLPKIEDDQIYHLNKKGIAKIGSFVKEGDILVGKETPLKKKRLDPHNKLLNDVMNKEAATTKDTSLRVPKGVHARVVHTKIIESETFPRAKPAEKVFIDQQKVDFDETKGDCFREKETTKFEQNISFFATNNSESYFTQNNSFLPSANHKKKTTFFVPLQSVDKQFLPKGWYHLDHHFSFLIDKKKKRREFFVQPKKVYIFLAEKRSIQRGDKLAGRHGNKGIVSQILPRQDMPYLPDGTPVDMVLNPLGVPSRMNVGQIFESLLGLAGSFLDEQYTIAPFDEAFGPEASRALVYSKLYQASLKTKQSWLFHPDFPGKMKLFDGRTGFCFDQPVTVGKAYILKLVHLVDEKIHARSTGPYSLLTQQPLRGRSKQGGQRLGEMEVWALEGFGAAYTLQELLTIKSDDIKGRHNLMSAVLDKKPLPWNTSESFKVLLRELQSVCLNIGLFALDRHYKFPGTYVSRKKVDLIDTI